MTSSNARAAIYCRISRDAEQDGLGVMRQEEDCRKLAEQQGFEVVEVYVDNDISASTKARKPRPSYDRMLSHARQGRFQAIVAYSNSRLTRRPSEWIDLIELANSGRLRVKTVASGEHDLSTADGRAVALTVAAWDAAEAERTAERVARAHVQLAEQGKHIGPRPFGWDFAPEADERGYSLRINPAEAGIVRECVRRTLAGEGLWRIRNDLNGRGVTTSTGAPWQTQTLRRVLLRWRNCGLRTHQGKVIGPGQWDPLIDRETHERVLAVLQDPARKSNNRGTAVRYLLTGIARCGACLRPLVGTNEFTYEVKVPPLSGGSEPRTKVRHYPHAYKCPHAGCMAVQRNMADLDRFVSEVIVKVLSRDGVRVLGGDPRAHAEASARLQALEAKLALAADQFADDLITAEQLARISGRLRPQADSERARIFAAVPEPSLAPFTGSAAHDAWRDADVEARRRVLRYLAQRLDLAIIVDRVGAGNGRSFDPESIRITWR